MDGVLREILRSQVHVVLSVVLLWSAIGLVVGIGLGALTSRLLSRTGGLSLAWRHGRWTRGLAYAWILLSFALLGASLGALEGGLRGWTHVLSTGTLRVEVVDRSATLAARGLLEIDAQLSTGNEKGESGAPEWADFQSGQTEWNAVAFFGRLRQLEEGAVQRLLDAARKRVSVGVPQDRHVLWLLDRGLSLVVWYAVDGRAAVQIERFNQALPVASAASGDPQGLTCQELTRLISSELLVPYLARIVRKIVRSQEVVLLCLVMASVSAVLAAFWIGRKAESWIARRKERHTPEAVRER